MSEPMIADRTVILCLLGIAAGQAVTLLTDPRALPTTSTAALLAALAVLTLHVGENGRNRAAAAEPDSSSPYLVRWQARAAMLVDHADGSAADWDRRIRPYLAREFHLCLGHRATMTADERAELGRAHFGPQLWHWIDPGQAARSGDQAPGRETFTAIVERLGRL
ncbi:hypothetical protein [Nocardia cyriacigeorgica]|uniref:hypothetical protein n=1 Tax=Nocardia cyriacigeorgica TaxID=135487 RepID=UPI001893C739|nr:hypothetical protein [Nocardia cyriacigeorgica]MBF6321350.1 hypothetical protein [Nocardia cyriacigeorgica]